MNLWSAKNRRFCALLLLAALALLQVRVAFAACEMAPPQKAVGSVAPCCIGHDSTMGAHPVEQMAAACVDVTCAERLDAAQADPRLLAESQIPWFGHAPASSASIASTSDASLRVSAAQAHPAHTPLIYVLQRLLI